MIKKTKFVSQLVAEAIDEPSLKDQRAIISMTGPTGKTIRTSREPRLKKDSWGDVLRLIFHDIDPKKCSKETARRRILFSEKQAVEVLRFLKKNEDRSEIIVHCEAGVSRSAGCAKFIAHIYQLEFPETYSLYNRHVFSTLLAVYGRCAFGEGSIKPSDLPAWRLNQMSYKE